MKFTITILVALATLAAASPAHRRRGSHGPDHSQGGGVGGYGHGGHSGLGGYGGSHGSSGPCDMSSEDTGCYLISDNRGCFLNTNNVTRVLECVDPVPSVAIGIFCRCWGCNGNQLTNFMPTLNCTSHTAIPPSNSTSTTLTPGFQPPHTSTSISTRLPLSTGTGVGTATSATTAAPSSPIHGYENTTTTWAKNHTRMPVPIVSHISHD